MSDGMMGTQELPEILLRVLHDDPDFRRGLAIWDAAFEEHVRLQEGAIRAIRQYLEEAARCSEHLPRVLEQLEKMTDSGSGFWNDGSDSLRILKAAISAEYSIVGRMLKDLGTRLLYPLLQGRVDDVASIRQSRKLYERALERYEAVLAKHATGAGKPGSSVSRSASLPTSPNVPDKPLIFGEQSELCDVRRDHYNALAEYITELHRFRAGIPTFWTDKVSVWIDSLRDSSSLVSIVYNGVSHIDAPKDELTIEYYKVQREKFVELLKKEFDPSAALGLRLTEKYGRLFRKRSRGIGPPWRPVFVAIERGLFRFWPESANHNANQDSGSTSIDTNVLLCQIKLYESVERACCFEVTTPQKTLILQAESEEDLLDWLRIFENAKNAALKGPVEQEAILIDEDVQERLKKKKEGEERLAELDGVPDELKSLNLKLMLEDLVLFHATPVLLDSQLGELMAGGRDVYFMFVGKTEPVVQFSWSQIEQVIEEDSHESTLSTRVILQLANNKVDTNIGQRVSIVFIAGHHRRSAETLCDLLRLLAGPRKASLSDQQIIDAIHRRSSLEEDEEEGGGGEGETGKKRTIDEELQKQLQPPGGLDWPDHPIDAMKEYPPPNDSDLDAEPIATFTIHLPVHYLFHTLFNDPDGLLIKLLHSRRKDRDLKITYCGEASSSDDEGKRLLATLEYYVPLNTPVLRTKDTRCVEELRLTVDAPLKCYVIDVTANTPDMLYGDSFFTRSRYVLAYSSPRTTTVTTYFGMRFTKSVLVRGIIRATAVRTFGDYCQDLRSVLKEEAGRVRRLTTGKVVKSVSSASSQSIDGEEEVNVTRRNERSYTMILLAVGVVLLAVYIKLHRTARIPVHGHQYQNGGLVESAVVLEEAVARLENGRRLYKELRGCGEEKSARCEAASKEWKELMGT